MLVYFSIILLATCVASFAKIKVNGGILILRFGKTWKIEINKKFGICFWAVFAILAFFSAIRDGIGIDYYEYFRHIEIIQEGLPDYMEEGFQRVVLFLSRFDESPRFIVIVFGVITIWLYVRAIWEESVNVRDSIFIFLCWGYYFLTFNTIRNYFALALVLYAIKFIKEDKKSLFYIFVLIASTFHKTALVCIPIYFLATLKLRKEHFVLLSALTLAALVGKKYLRRIVFIFYPHFENNVYDTGRISYFNIIKALAIILLCLYCYRQIERDKMNRFFFNLNVFSFLFYVGMYWTPEISRIGFYMNATSIFLVPNAVESIHSVTQRKRIRGVLYVGSILMFVLLCREYYTPTTKLLPYAAWLLNNSY